MKKFELIVSGRVQGVGFRYFVQTKALKYSILGEVKNLDNGDVYIIAEGMEKNLKNFIDAVKLGSSFSKVLNITIKELEITSNLKKFKITY